MQVSVLSSIQVSPSLLADALINVLCRTTENQKVLLLLHRPTFFRTMSTMKRLLGVLGWVSPNDEDSVGGIVPQSGRPNAGHRPVTWPPRMKPRWAGGLAMSFTPLRLTFVTSVRVER